VTRRLCVWGVGAQRVRGYALNLKRSDVAQNTTREVCRSHWTRRGVP
jgi:hypothetical protein